MSNKIHVPGMSHQMEFDRGEVVGALDIRCSMLISIINILNTHSIDKTKDQTNINQSLSSTPQPG